MTAWGGHQNGRIPLDVLTYVGPGVLSGAPQYLHPAVALAWRGFVTDVWREHGVGLLLTEGYRTIALQEHYWARWIAGRGNSAAFPGTSSHGWATAVDMANYLAVPVASRRAIAQRHGFSFATGDRVGEPWHIEYVGSLALAGSPGENLPIPETPPEEEEEEMSFWRKHDSHELWLLMAPGVETVRIRDHATAALISRTINNGKAAERASSQELGALIAACEASIPQRVGLSETQLVAAIERELAAALDGVARTEEVSELRDAVMASVVSVADVKRVLVEALEGIGVTADLRPLLTAIDALPSRTVDELRGRLL